MSEPATPSSPLPPVLLAEAFDRDEVTDLRHAVARVANAAGLSGQRLDDFVLAVNEIMTNAVRHTGGRGWIRLWITGTRLHCEITDTGGGIPTHWLDARRPAPDLVAGGRGLWIARRLCDDMCVETGPTGTAVCLGMALPAR